MDIDHQLIREIKTTPASVHDSQIDLIKRGEVGIEIEDILEHHAKVITPQ
jgi:hypothetical protein